MTEKLSNNLRDLLLKSKKIVLPNIGEFSLIRFPASKDENANTLSPPKYKIVFKNIDINNEEESESLNPLSSYSQKLLTQLVNKGVARIKGIGILSKNNSHFDFSQNEATATWYTNGMPSISLTRVKKKRSISNYFLPKVLKIQDHALLWDLIPAILVASLMIGLYLNYDKTTIPKHQVITKTPIVIDNDTVQKTEATDTIIDLVNTPKIDSQSQLQNTIPDTSNLISRKCVIITGVFKTRTYRNKMIKRLEDLGYTVHLSEMGNKTRVGLEFDCTDTDLESYLKEIRGIVDDEAWYLQ